MTEQTFRIFQKLLFFINSTHFSGNVFLLKEHYDEAIAAIPSDVYKELESNFLFFESKVFLRGHNYYLPGRRDQLNSKLETLFSNMIALNNLIPEYAKIDFNDYTARLIFSSVFDHLKHYSMILFNGFYRKQKNHS